MQLVLDTNGLMVKKRNNSFWIIHKDQRRMISPHRIDSIAVTADCLLSSAAIRLAAQHQIPIYFFNAAGRAEARLWSAQFGSIATIRRQQVLFALEPAATEWVIGLLRIKLSHQLGSLALLKQKLPPHKKQIQSVQEALEKKWPEMEQWSPQSIDQVRNQIMGTEGYMARLYWQAIGSLLPEMYRFSTRSRRPARDFFNAALNYLYGMLYGLTGSAILAAGLDPHLGFLHVDAYNKPTFTFDLIEPFRPWVDQLLIQSCLEGKLSAQHFEEREAGLSLSKAGKAYLIPLFNDWLAEKIRYEGKTLSRKNHVYRFAGSFAQLLLKQSQDVSDQL